MYGSELPFYFGTFDISANDPPLKVMRNPEYYFFSHNNLKNPLKATLPISQKALKKYVLTHAPVLKDKVLKDYNVDN